MQNGGIWAMEAMDLVHLAEGRQERAKSSIVELFFTVLVPVPTFEKLWFRFWFRLMKKLWFRFLLLKSYGSGSGSSSIFIP
jgi:hypothetical protein